MVSIKRFDDYKLNIPLSTIDQQIIADLKSNSPSSVTGISKRTGLDRIKVSYHVYRLSQRGLVSVNNVKVNLTLVSFLKEGQ